jgi:hypothetical protein
MVQELITYIIIFAAAGFTLYRLYLNFFPKKGKSNTASCAGCAGCGLAGGNEPGIKFVRKERF